MNNKRNNAKTMITNIIFIFLTGALIGWLYEVILHIFTSEAFVNRGILHGPWLPIYGTGCLLIVGLKKLIGNRWMIYFVISTVACGMVEYMTSWLMETVYHTRWWDYSNMPLNLNGRIFVGGLLGFGAAGCIFAYGLLPILTRQYQKIPVRIKTWTAGILFAVFLLDVVLSLFCPNMGVGITNG